MANELSDDDMNAVSGGVRGLGPREPVRPRPRTDANPKLPNQPEKPPDQTEIQEKASENRRFVLLCSPLAGFLFQPPEKGG